ncbi:hypothetical protein F1559_001681 [Cyanidiococcus yangmingshanensis]|uniref:Vps72/YL1 C-terminal domain-containing protein n=1 Tax=Cyanidiococcus yangmingshanensis TaxID=2690220 RepID=A0A7J7IMQ9_9RHOD|nr:hypothetical protein F1559_001681 [Cyanidiococcus yangmingshanensis]
MNMSDTNQQKQARRVLPARSTRGQRMHQLIGEELEADELFWNQDALRESSTEDEEEFETSDASELSSADDAVSSSEEAEDANPALALLASGGSAGVDEEAEALVQQAERFEHLRKRKKRYRFGKYEDIALKNSAVEHKSRARSSRSARHNVQEASDYSGTSHPASEWSVSRDSLRRSTRAASAETTRLLEERESLRAQRQLERQRRAAEQTQSSPELTQEARLEEALHVTEPASRRELEHLLEMVDEKQSESKKAGLTQKCWSRGNRGLLWWYRGYRPRSELSKEDTASTNAPQGSEDSLVEWIAFRDEACMPWFWRESHHPSTDKSIARDDQPDMPARGLEQRCTVTGGPARYRDPLTGYYYADAEGFRILRQRYQAAHEGSPVPDIAPGAGVSV